MLRLKIIGRKTGWNLFIFKSKSPYPYRAYAIHVNGKVEAEGSYANLNDAIMAGGDLVRVLNIHHLYGGRYVGKDKLVGKPMDSKFIDRKAKILTAVIQKLIAANNRIFGIKD